MVRKIGHDFMTVDTVQIVEDSACCLVVNAVITKVGVYDYPDGRAFKSPMELLKASRTARAAKIAVLAHPADPTPVIMSQSQMKGNVEKAFFDRDKIRARLNFDKHENDPAFLETVRAAAAHTGKPLDVSIGFYYKADVTPGSWKDVKGAEHPYDYVMRDIVIDHVACGVPRGRCSFPDCGIGVDQLIQGHFHKDYETMEECIADNKDKEDPAAFCAWLLKQTGVCTPAQIDAYMKRLKEKVKKMVEDPKEAFIKAKEAEGMPRKEAEEQYADLTNPAGQKGVEKPETPGVEGAPETEVPDKEDAALEAKFCAICGTALVENKCPNKDCSVFGKTVNASSDVAKKETVTDKAEVSIDSIVERTEELLEMRAEKDTRARAQR